VVLFVFKIAPLILSFSLTFLLWEFGSEANHKSAFLLIRSCMLMALQRFLKRLSNRFAGSVTNTFFFLLVVWTTIFPFRKCCSSSSDFLMISPIRNVNVKFALSECQKFYGCNIDSCHLQGLLKSILNCSSFHQIFCVWVNFCHRELSNQMGGSKNFFSCW